MKTYDWIVIGAGITGAALSYELVKIGFSVLLLEKNKTLQNATHYSYGGLAFWSGTTELTRQLCDEGMTRHRNLRAELDADTELRHLNLLLTIPADTNPEAVAESYAKFAIPPKLLSVKEACELEPLLNGNAISGALTVKHGHIHPEKTAQAYIQAFLRAGGEIQITQVLELQSSLKCSVKTNTETYHAANIAVCVGGLTRQLLKSSGIAIKLYFSHAGMIEIPSVELRLQTLVMPANLQRFQLEAQSTKIDEVWDEGEVQLAEPILDVGAIQFQDASLYLGQITYAFTNPDKIPQRTIAEAEIRNGVGKTLPALKDLPGKFHHCLVAFSSDSLPLIGNIPEYPNLHIFSGFSNPLVIVPPLAQRFASQASGQQDEIITQLSPTRF
ncbi:MAG: FAD-binding oxidoreductase [Cyanomargarita calcarea GSE-NOS-MK-12-04C]|jgi:glycine/D-amino acid oxidase-like deaminating enzyme|uniref:FAD-binding oxidoreductase n=1 Tax=Cyanomargarita calcarea GSE-NOS-MK-12-04C TaxID=2839659 RepID=A0A951QN57_9CYAN|nr:FAD-binding oxidoreductase [Cyanomargarita calcarea GSE-NOS-MK-12-04C]